MSQTNHKGFSLLELLLAIVLASIITVVIYQVYLSCKSVYANVKTNSELQENIRFAANILSHEIGTAGFAGCPKLINIEKANLTDLTGQDFTYADSLRGYKSSASSLPSYLKNAMPNTDVIVIKKAGFDQVYVTGNKDVKSGDTAIQVQHNPATTTNRLLLISDCENADLFEAKNYDSGVNINLKSDYIHHNYKVMNATVSLYAEEAFFIGKRTENDDKGNPVYGLYKITNGGNQEELVENIISMSIKYGVDINADSKVDKYFSADEIDNLAAWENVKSVVITLGHPYHNYKTQTWDIYIQLRERS